jgi:hypothetical protein
MKNWKRLNRILFCAGLIMVESPMLLREYTPMPDFVRGLLEGVGLGLMIFMLIRQRPLASSCFGRSRNLSEPAIKDKAV